MSFSKRVVLFLLLLASLFAPGSSQANHVTLEWPLSTSSSTVGYYVYSCPTEPCVIGGAIRESALLSATTRTFVPTHAERRIYFVVAVDSSGAESVVSQHVSLSQVAPLPPSTLTIRPSSGVQPVEPPPGGDVTPPSVVMTAPTSGQTVSETVTLAASASDNVGVLGVQFRVNSQNVGAEDTTPPYGVSWDTLSGNFPNGSYTLTAVARDAAGFTTTSSGVQVTLDNDVGTTPVDTIHPTVVMTAPINGATISGSAVPLQADASDNVGVVGVQFKRVTGSDTFNEGPEDTTPPYTSTFNTIGWNGPHDLTAVARDAAGNVTTSAIVAVVVDNTTPGDTTFPTVAITSPANLDPVSGTVPITADASDNVGVVGVQFKANGSNVCAEDTISPYSCDWVTTANGDFTLTAVARDAAGNHTTSAAISVTVSGHVAPAFPPIPAAGIAAYPATMVTPYAAPGGATTAVNSGANLQSAINAASCGTKLNLEAAATFTGNFVLPSKGCTAGNEIYIQSANLGSLPAYVEVNGQAADRAGSTHAADMPNIQAASGLIFRADLSAGHYRLVGLEIISTDPDWEVSGAVHDAMVNIGQQADGSYPTSQALFPHHIFFDRVYVHAGVNTAVKNGVSLHCASCGIMNSTISEIHMVGQDGGHGVGGYAGPGPFKIVNNDIEVSGINVLFGGAQSWVSGQSSSDVFVHRNYLHKNPCWFVGSACFVGTEWTAKNLVEFKHGYRMLVDANYLEYSWCCHGGQFGFAFLSSVQNDQCTTDSWHEVDDLTIQRNIIRHVANMMTISGFGICQTRQSNRLVVRENLFWDVDYFAWGGQGNIFGFMYKSGYGQTRVTHNTVIAPTNNTSVRWCEDSAFDTFHDNNIQTWGTGIVGSTSLANCMQGTSSMVGNVLIGGNPAVTPGGNQHPATPADVGFTNYAGGDYSLAAGSPFKNSATDTTDPGVNWANLQAVITGVHP